MSRAIERQKLDEGKHFLLLDTDIDALEGAITTGFATTNDAIGELRKTHQWLIRAAFGVMASLLTTSLLLFVNLYHG